MRVFVVMASLMALATAELGYHGNGFSSSSSGSSSGYSSGGFGSTGFSGGVDSYAAPQPSSGGPYPSSGYGAPPQAPVIHKHVYVHVPPPEPEYIRPQKTYNVPAPQKHYKIVFIKAPAPPVPTAPVIPAFPQDEQKTLIYVLVKKPEEQPDIEIPTPAPTKPSKPEVYFIRYKTQKEQGAKYGPPAVAPPSTYGAPSGPSIPDTTYRGPLPSTGPSSSYGPPQ
ncbi:uncharacterized protein LOC132198773 [Neocloeon triangulifer]|uniref:uncharacterized protein LOC132198773 n=1 Tax=Neocloeon triangulifer TaxID=2078957 RepID=UPI00286F9EE2|nr:uncharacterized protein LOC132198773 [Neocloeon triangulifer]